MKLNKFSNTISSNLVTAKKPIQGCHMVRKSGKTKKNDKSKVKMGVFEKSQGIFF